MTSKTPGRVDIRSVRVGGSLRVEASESASVTDCHVDGDIHVRVTDIRTALLQSLTQEALAPPTRPSGFFQRDFHRDSNSGPLFGVCEGLANDFGINPLWLRLAFVVTAFAGGPGILAYLIAWVLLPDRESEVQPAIVGSTPENQDAFPEDLREAHGADEDLREAWREVNKITKN